MYEIQFSWDPVKAATNKKKHGISFLNAVSVFTDEHALLIRDFDHSLEEDRFIILGMTWEAKLLVVSHSFNDFSSTIRIISARKANAKEKREYETRNA